MGSVQLRFSARANGAKGEPSTLEPSLRRHFGRHYGRASGSSAASNVWLFEDIEHVPSFLHCPRVQEKKQDGQQEADLEPVEDSWSRLAGSLKRTGRHNGKQRGRGLAPTHPTLPPCHPATPRWGPRSRGCDPSLQPIRQRPIASLQWSSGRAVHPKASVLRIFACILPNLWNGRGDMHTHQRAQTGRLMASRRLRNHDTNQPNLHASNGSLEYEYFTPPRAAESAKSLVPRSPLSIYHQDLHPSPLVSAAVLDVRFTLGEN